MLSGFRFNYMAMNIIKLQYESRGGEEAPLGWGVENWHNYYVALTSIHTYRIETIVDS